MPNAAILDDLGARFKVKSGDYMPSREKLSAVKFVCGSGRQKRCPICFVPREKLSPARFWPWRGFVLCECSPAICLFFFIFEIS